MKPERCNCESKNQVCDLCKGLKEAKEGVDMVGVGVGQKYATVDDMLADIDKHYNIFDHIEILWHRYFWNWVSDLKWRIPNWWQRGQKGWGKADTWDFSLYLSKVIYEGLTHMKNNGNGYIVWKEKDTDEQMKARSDKVWDSMIYAFHLAYQIENGEREFNLPNAKPADRKKFKCISKKEKAKMEAGMRVFIKYFHCLWD